MTVSLLPVFNVMVFDTRVLPEPTAKQQEVTVQGVVQMVMNMKSQPRPATPSRTASGRKF